MLLRKTWFFVVMSMQLMGFSFMRRFPKEKDLCGQATKCVFNTRCKSYCDLARLGTFQKNRTALAELQSMSCGVQLISLSQYKSKVCCANADVTESDFCNEDDPVQDPVPVPVPVQQTSYQCGRRIEQSLRVLGGTDAVPGDFPWIVQLRNDAGIPCCGAALVSDKHIVTAAHCLGHTTRSLVLGENDVTTKYDCFQPKGSRGCTDTRACVLDDQCAPGSVTIDIKDTKVLVHPKYVSTRISTYDIAIITLNNRINITDFILPICLPDPAEDSSRFNTNTDYETAGWGNFKDFQDTIFGKNSNILQKVQVRGMSDTEEPCKTLRNLSENYNTDIQLCAGSEEEGRGVCTGDSGGPLSSRKGESNIYELAGITSFGLQQCGGRATIYTKIAGSILKWLHSNINDTSRRRAPRRQISRQRRRRTTTRPQV